MFDPLEINPGDLRCLIQVQSPDFTADGYGAQSVNPSSWTTQLTCKAKIENTNSRTFRESFSGGDLVSQSTDVITIRWPGASINVKPGWRVVFGDNAYTIQAVDNVQRRNRKLVLACAIVGETSS